jgi:hypothetical protein
MLMLAVIVRESGRSGIPKTAMIEAIWPGVLDRPVEPGDDSIGCGRVIASQRVARTRAR